MLCPRPGLAASADSAFVELATPRPYCIWLLAESATGMDGARLAMLLSPRALARNPTRPGDSFFYAEKSPPEGRYPLGTIPFIRDVRDDTLQRRYSLKNLGTIPLRDDTLYQRRYSLGTIPFKGR